MGRHRGWIDERESSGKNRRSRRRLPRRLRTARIATLALRGAVVVDNNVDGSTKSDGSTTTSYSQVSLTEQELYSNSKSKVAKVTDRLHSNTIDSYEYGLKSED